MVRRGSDAPRAHVVRQGKSDRERSHHQIGAVFETHSKLACYSILFVCSEGSISMVEMELKWPSMSLVRAPLELP